MKNSIANSPGARTIASAGSIGVWASSISTRDLTIKTPVGSGWIDSSTSVSTSGAGSVGTLIKPSVAYPAPAISENRILSGLSPVGRIRFMAKRNPFELTVWGLAAIGGVFLTLRGVLALAPMALFEALSITAQAQVQGEATAVPQTTISALLADRSPFEWYVGILMGICLLSSLIATLCCKTESKIAWGKDTNKMIVGFVIGYLSGGKAR